MADNFRPEGDENPYSEAPKKTVGGSGKVAAGKYDIDTRRPLSNFEHEYAEAYECTNTETSQNDNVAIVIKDRFPVRKDFINKTLGGDIEGLMNLRTTIMANWPDGTQRYVLIFKRPEGHPILQLFTQRREPLSEETVRRGIIRSIYQTLKSNYAMGLFHGNIRPSNIFLTNHENALAILGEAISSVPGINQPVIYETIERGMTNPEARGIGS